MGWNVHSTPWNVYSSPWNIRSVSWNIKLRCLQREYHPAAKPNAPKPILKINMPTDKERIIDFASFSCSFRGILHFFHAKSLSLFSKLHDYGTAI